jgi:NDP-sugar pyrophosphorylase family protein
MTIDFTRLERMRAQAGFLTVRDLMARFGETNMVLDPFSILMTEDVRLGEGNVLHPGIRLVGANGYQVVLGDQNTLFPGTVLEATAGNIAIGNANEIGEGGFSARANRALSEILIGSNGRYQGNACVFGKSSLGSGTQILGQITVSNCTLEAGEDYKSSDPDLRGGLLKGCGSAQHIHVPCGQVIAGWGEFRAEMLVAQRTFHPKMKAATFEAMPF